jgi:uncharacterized membrane protein
MPTSFAMEVQMEVFIVLLVSLAAFRVAGFRGVAALNDWNLPLRLALCLMFMVAASAHWGRGRADLVRMVPTALPAPGILVTVTGLLGIEGAVGLLLPQTARAAAICLAVLLIALFPAYVRAARHGFTILGRPAMSVAVRGAMQAVFIVALLATAAGVGT